MSQKEKPCAVVGRGLARIPDVVFVMIEVLVLLGMLVRALQVRSVMPLVPTADPDAWGYLYPALSWLGGFGLQQTAGRDWLYPALLALFLKTAGSFAGIVLWQKFLGIFSGLLMSVTWRCWVSTLPIRRWILFLASLCGVLPILAQLTNAQSIYFETSIRPEAVLSFFVYAQLACLMGYYKYRWHTPNGDRREESAPRALFTVIFGAAAIFLSYVCLLLKPSWFFAFAFTSVPVFVGLFGRALSLRARLLAPALGVGFSFLLLWLPGRVFLIKDSTSKTFLPATLFTIHARLIDEALEAKLAGMPDADPEKARLLELVAVLEKELHTSEKLPSAWQKLGFDPDYLYYRSQLIPAIYRYTGNDDRKFAAFCYACYRDAAVHDPGAFLGKIWLQFTHFLFPTPDTFFKDFHDFAEYYRDSTAVLAPNLPDRFPAKVREMYDRYKADLVVHGGSSLMLDRKSKFRTFRHVFAPRVLAIEVLFLFALAASLIWRPLRDLRMGGWAAFSLFSAPLGNAITVSIVHALDINRYRHTYGGFLLFAVVAMDLYAALVIVRSVRHAAEVISKRSPGSWRSPN